MKLKDALETALEIVTENTFNKWMDLVATGFYTERAFIRSCFWADDPIDSEQAYQSILDAFKVLEKHGLPKNCNPNHEVIVQGVEVLIVTVEERYIN